MPVLTKVKWAAIALAVAGCVWLGWWVQGLRAENTRLTEAVQGLETALAAAEKLRSVDQKVALQHAKTVATLTTQKEAQDAKLRQALAENAPWRDAVVPGSVLDALRVPDSPEP